MLLVMDYMEGGPVMTRDALEKGRCIPEPLALQYFRDMCKVSLSFCNNAYANAYTTGKLGYTRRLFSVRVFNSIAAFCCSLMQSHPDGRTSSRGFSKSALCSL